jgi:hypothetical protein
MTSLPKYKKWILFFIVLFVALSIVTPVLADYLGPNRSVTQTVGVCKIVLNECQYVEAKEDWRNKNVEDWLCSNESKPWQAYSSNSRTCNAGNNGYQYWSREESSQETIVTYPPATIAGSLQNCSIQNGWCVSTPELFLSSNEPVSGYSILAIEGTLNGQTFACSAANCNIPLNEGDNNFTYWAISSWGDSSTMGAFTARVDTVPPNLSLDISGSSGANGWYVSPVTLMPIGSDSVSGLAGALLSVDSGVWQSSVTLNEGVYDIAVTASDNAGNVSNASTTIAIDITTPSINVSVSGTAGKNSWYKSSVQVSAVAGDATSGVGTFEVSADGGSYQSYTSSIAFSDGHHTIQFKAIDNAGNVTETPLQEFYVDTIAPSIELPTSWELGKKAHYGVQDHGSGLADLRLVIEDEDERYAKVALNMPVSGATYSKDINWNGEFKDKTVAPPGTYLVWLKASDLAGNERVKLGKVIVPEPNVFFNLLGPDASPAETPPPPEDLYGPEDSSTTATLPALDFGGSTTDSREVTSNSLFLTRGTSASIPSTSSNVLWGSAAAAAIGAATAYAMAERRKREEAEKDQAMQVAAGIARDEQKRAEKKQKQQENWIKQVLAEAQRKKQEKTSSNPDIPDGISPEAQQAFLHGGTAAQGWIGANISQLQQAYAKQLAVARGIQKRNEEKKKAEEEEKLRAAWAAYSNARRQEETTEEIAVVTPTKKKTWWQKTIDWIDDHQTEIALGIGVVVGVTAVVLTAGLATPLVAAALVAGATVSAGVAAASMTVGLNAYYDRPWHENLLRNTAFAGGAALVTSLAAFLYLAVSTSAGAYCFRHQSTCARIEPIFNAIDKVEETWLRGKLTIQTWRGDQAGAAETAFDLHSEYADGGMPGNAVAKELGDQLTHLSKNAAPLIQKHGKDVIPLLVKYGDEGLELIQKFGADGIDLLRKYGNDATDLVVLDDDVLDYVMQQGPDAVEALSRWSKADLLAHGPALALRAKKDAEVLAEIKKLTSSGPIDPKNLTEEQKVLIESIAANSTQYADNGQVVLGKWVDNSSGFVQTAQDTGSVHYNPHPDMWIMLGRLGNAKQEEVAWLINKQVVQNGIAKGLPFEYTLNGIPSDSLTKEGNAVEAIFAGATDAEIMRILRSDYVPIRIKELKELQKAGYQYVFDEATNSYILMLP